MRINPHTDRKGTRYFAFPDVHCKEHWSGGCPYINAKVPDE